MSDQHVIPVLRAKRAEIKGHVIELEKRLGRYRSDLANIDAAIRILTPGADPEAIPAKKLYGRIWTRYFARNELGRLALDTLRPAKGTLPAQEIAMTIMRAKEMAVGDYRLCATVTEMVLTALCMLAKRGNVVRSGASRDARWAISAAP